MSNPWKVLRDAPLDESKFDSEFAVHPPTTPGFSPSFILPGLYLSGDSLSTTWLWKHGVRLIVDARKESPLRSRAKKAVEEAEGATRNWDKMPIEEILKYVKQPHSSWHGANCPKEEIGISQGALKPMEKMNCAEDEIHFYDVEYRTGYKFPTLTAASLTVFHSQEEALKILHTRQDDNGVEGCRFVVMNVPALDQPEFKISKYFRQSADVLDYALTKAGVGVLVHCAAGVSRSPSLITCFLCEKFGMGADKIISFLRQRRPMVFPFHLLNSKFSFLEASYKTVSYRFYEHWVLRITGLLMLSLFL